MYVYFMQSGKNGPIKIGKSNNPEKRMISVQTGNPYKLRLVAVIYCDDDAAAYRMESRFHRILKKHRMHGEWFYPNFSFKNIMKAKLIAKDEKEMQLIKKGEKFVAINEDELDEAIAEEHYSHMASIMNEA